MNQKGGRVSLPAVELWKDIPGYEGAYQASSLGRIRSMDRYSSYLTAGGHRSVRRLQGRILRPCPSTSGYLHLRFCRGGRNLQVHQLVMLTFAGPCPAGMEVMHRNGNRQDNRLVNLCYGTHQTNVRDVVLQGGRIRTLCRDDIEAIRFGLSCGHTHEDLAGMYGVTVRQIRRIERKEAFAWVA